MRIFGKVLQTLRLSRRQPNFKPRRYSSILCSHNSARRTNLHNRNSKHGSIRSMAAKSDSSNKGNDISKTSLTNILPVALIQSKSATTSTKIMLIPLNLFDGDDDASKNTMKTLSIIREHARQIEAFTENVMGTAESTQYGVPLASNNAGALMDQCSGKDDVTLWTHDEEISNSHALQPSEETIKSNHISLYEKLERAMAEQERNRIETHDCYEVAAWNSSKRDLVVYVPENLEQKLQQMAIASMQLIFEMDMSNIRDAIFRSAALEKINMFKPPTPKTLEDPTVKIEANLDLGKDKMESTIPLDFNAMIQGTVEIDPSKYTPSVLGEIKVPEFNDCVTTIAANICSTALQKGFPADLSRMAYSTKSPAKNKSANRDPHIVCVRDGSKGCVSPGNADYPKFKPQDANTQQAKEKTNKASISSEISLLSSSEIIDAYNSRGLMSCKAYARALIEATKRRAEIANKGSVPCDDKKSVKKEAFKKKDKCGDTKNNPCTKPLIDECGNEIKKNCPTRKKKDKKKDPCKGDDPCKKAASKDEGSCTTPGVPKPCAGKRKKKPTKDKGKKDICGNAKKGNRCNTETDACQQEKKRPKPKKKKCDLGDPCKDPCLNINEQSDKNKKEFSSGKDNKCKMVKSLCDMNKSQSSTCASDKAAKKSKSTSDVKKTDSKCESSKAKKTTSSKSKCKPFNSASSKDSNKSKCGSDGKSGGKAKNLCDVKKPPSKPATNKECKRYEGFCKSKDSKTSCSSDKGPGKKSNADKSGSKCKPIKSLCDAKKSKSDKKPDCKSESKPKSASKCKPIKSLCEAKKSASSDKKSSSKSADCKTTKSSSPKSDSKDHCQTKKKSTKPNCKTKPGSSAKKYSTLANNKSFVEMSPIKRYFSTIPVYSIPRGFISWRQFSSKKSGKGKKKGNKDDGMCAQYQSKPKIKRTDKLERRKPKLDCYSDPDECQEQACKDPMKSSCANIKKENENPSALRFRTCLHMTNRFPVLHKRNYGTDSCNENRARCYEEDAKNYESEKEQEIEECTDEENTDSYLINKTRNEVIRILEPCTVERCLEALPKFNEYDVLIRTEAVALSGSDLHYYETGGQSYPGMTLGHDASGIVQEVGCSITKIRPGDRVVVESGLACGICDYCKKGCYNICNNLIFNGFLRKYQVHPADLCHKIPADVDMIEATLTQTLALGCQACFKAQVLPTTNVLIIGAGPTAISAALCARAIGVGNICVASTIKEPLETIEKTFHFKCMHYDADMQYCMILECLYSALHDWPDAVINCAVSEKSMNLSVMALKPCGICILAECDAECACFNAMDVLMKNLKLIPSFRSINMFPTALQLIDGGKAPIGRLVANVFQWSKVEVAFRKALHESNIGNKKVVIRCAEEDKDIYKKEDCKT
ncbi:uncharacterized protein LOC105229516 [Bactrocera dorsalis]|uniref:Uncharacterized protein LOC105229516 n=1 Tax=Bactrocera dorsalis TaxID=27457 RepID=A0A6I9VEI1_BACDO|nr:uncharacterized protein LOC105229516 [Bactrocera dorsalis]